MLQDLFDNAQRDKTQEQRQKNHKEEKGEPDTNIHLNSAKTKE